MPVTIGRIVHYVLSEQDVKAINRQRVYGVGPVGVQAYVGNQAIKGESVPALVVWPHDNEQQTFNGPAFLDGNDVLWLTSVPYNADSVPGTWHWPPIVAQSQPTANKVGG